MLSVVIITYNEEENIARCIDSVKDLATEVLVVDSFSTDGTESICRDMGARFLQHTFEGYALQKQYALEQASYDLVLSIDADEALSERLGNSIRKVLENRTHDAYSMNRLTNYCGKWIRHGGWYPDRKLRLFDRTKGHWEWIYAHDKLIMETGSTFGHLKGDLLHYSFPSIESHLNQVNKFSTLSAETFIKSGKKSSLFNILVNPWVKFVKDYFIRMGFLDGYYGFMIARISAHATFLKYAKLWHLQRIQKP